MRWPPLFTPNSIVFDFLQIIRLTFSRFVVCYTQLYLIFEESSFEIHEPKGGTPMREDVFQLCRERVSAEEAARFYGYAPDRRGKILCPFHPDKHPSLSFHRGFFRCWSCGASGSAIDFAARLFGLTPLEAVRKLNGDLGLDLPLDREPDPEERERARREAELREARQFFQKWREELLTRLCAAIRAGNGAKMRPMEDWSPAECLEVREGARLEWYADTLEAGSLEEQMEIFRQRKEVRELCERTTMETTGADTGTRSWRNAAGKTAEARSGTGAA